MANPARGLLNREKKEKKKSGSAIDNLVYYLDVQPIDTGSLDYNSICHITDKGMCAALAGRSAVL